MFAKELGPSGPGQPRKHRAVRRRCARAPQRRALRHTLACGRVWMATDGGLTLDLSRMKSVHVDPANRIVRVQGGASLGERDRETQVFGLAVPAGVVSTTGVAGLTLGGGTGWQTRKRGLTIDNLLSVDIVTADGTARVASASENPDLFWAVRGGGGNFGIVTSFEYRAYP